MGIHRRCKIPRRTVLPDPVYPGDEQPSVGTMGVSKYLWTGVVVNDLLDSENLKSGTT